MNERRFIDRSVVIAVRGRRHRRLPFFLVGRYFDHAMSWRERSRLELKTTLSSADQQVLVIIVLCPCVFVDPFVSVRTIKDQRSSMKHGGASKRGQESVQERQTYLSWDRRFPIRLPVRSHNLVLRSSSGIAMMLLREIENLLTEAEHLMVWTGCFVFLRSQPFFFFFFFFWFRLVFFGVRPCLGRGF